MLQAGFRSRLASKLGGKLDFYKGWLSNPKGVGAIAPSSPAMARKMAEETRVGNDKKVLEVGPGTGVFTGAILARGVHPDNLFAIEYNKSFLPGLRQRFPEVTFIHGDALDIEAIAREQSIEKFDTIISGLPLLNFPSAKRVQFVESMLDHLEPGRPLIQFSYGLSPPVPVSSNHFVAQHLGSVFGNLPPARIWAYKRV